MSELHWFETHAHLSEEKFTPDRDAVIKRALAAHVSTIIEIADGPMEWPQAKALAHQYPTHLKWAAGIHPSYADQAGSSNLEELKRLSQDPLLVAVGEIGLDYFKNCKISKQIQIETFSKIIDISHEVKKPMIIHCREAFEDLLPLLKSKIQVQSNLSPGVIHCFSGGPREAHEALKLGFYLGVDGPITYPNAQNLRDTLKDVPLDRLVLETDSPFLPPQNHRGKRNEPSFLPQIAACLAEIKNVTLFELSAQLHENSSRLFRLN